MVVDYDTATIANAILRRDRPWTEDAFLALPPIHHPRIELVDGALVVSPAAGLSHNRAQRRLLAAFQQAAGDEELAWSEVNLRVLPGVIREPDVVLLRERPLDDTYVEARNVLLVAEVVSPGGGDEHTSKREQYAQAGIPVYLICDPTPDGYAATVFRPDPDAPGRYIEDGYVPANGTVVIKEPVTLTIPLNSLGG